VEVILLKNLIGNSVFIISHPTFSGALGGEGSFLGERGRCNFAVWELISGLRVLSDSWGL
jgi:hypothetical protein